MTTHSAARRSQHSKPRYRTGDQNWVREHNLSIVLNYIWEAGKPIARARLTEISGLNKSTIGSLLAQLQAWGFVREALRRLAAVVADLPEMVRSRLTLENDDVSYTPRDLLPICQSLSLPLVYDVHHHRCNPDGLSVAEASALAAESWRALGREPYCHLSSPRAGWQGRDPKPHADYIDPEDFPDSWQGWKMTVDVEAKAKEMAVVRLMADLQTAGGI